ncbi:hypothetical protein [Enterobacter cloacae]|uniref:hypothetical protein n=1 Tax=Enterobacter cloacae TaxID=550 RepID=UPI0023E459DC|nr:hypothetical protein [Enterobacter cloacae]MDF3572992.1 hypothetical protein [Enterobacter cloacae]
MGERKGGEKKKERVGDKWETKEKKKKLKEGKYILHIEMSTEGKIFQLLEKGEKGEKERRKEREKGEERKKEGRERERDLFGARGNLGNSTPNLLQIRNLVKFLLSSTLFLV